MRVHQLLWLCLALSTAAGCQEKLKVTCIPVRGGARAGICGYSRCPIPMCALSRPPPGMEPDAGVQSAIVTTAPSKTSALAAPIPGPPSQAAVDQNQQQVGAFPVTTSQAQVAPTLDALGNPIPPVTPSQAQLATQPMMDPNNPTMPMDPNNPMAAMDPNNPMMMNPMMFQQPVMDPNNPMMYQQPVMDPNNPMMYQQPVMDPNNPMMIDPNNPMMMNPMMFQQPMMDPNNPMMINPMMFQQPMMDPNNPMMMNPMMYQQPMVDPNNPMMNQNNAMMMNPMMYQQPMMDPNAAMMTTMAAPALSAPPLSTSQQQLKQ